MPVPIPIPVPEALRRKLHIRSVFRETGCVVWTGRTNKKGYGQVIYGGHTYRSHRLAYAIATYTDPGELQVLHHCDNPSCVRFSHLFCGTNAENMADKRQKGRGRNDRSQPKLLASIDREKGGLMARSKS